MNKKNFSVELNSLHPIDQGLKSDYAVTSFGKKVTLVRHNIPDILEKIGKFIERSDWCEKNIGVRGDNWDSYSDCFVFTDPLDALRFKLTFK